MRRLVGVLRRPEEAPALAPQPSLEHLDRLVAQARESGLPVELRIEGEPTQLPPGVDLTAYRLVQEGLTNAIKHARASKADVVVRYGDGTRRGRRSPTTARAAVTAAEAGTVSSACASASPSTAASSKRARGRRAVTRSERAFPCKAEAMDERPSGTVTFLFTDIEGSTVLLRQLRDAYGDVLATHGRLLRRAFEEAGGQEIDTQGDSFFVAFSSPKDAVARSRRGTTLAGRRDMAGREPRSECGWGSTRATPRSRPTATSGFRCTARPASARPATAVRS